MKFLIIIICILSIQCKKEDDTQDTEPTTVKDVSGNEYSIIQINNQKWLGTNLKTTKLKDGSAISVVTDNTSWSAQTQSSMCYYENQPSTHNPVFGALYNWYAVNSGKLCPEGWRIPSESDYNSLVSFLGGDDIAGGKLKSTGTKQQENGYWSAPNEGATNETKFSAQPGGLRDKDGVYSGLGNNGNWWLSNQTDNSNARFFSLHFLYSDIDVTNREKESGLSVRCIKN